MTELALAPRMPGPPQHTLPAGACDCHAHVFGPYDRFPVAHVMPYAPPLAPASLHRDMLGRIGAARGVLTQPGAFGTDPATIVDALKAAPGLLRGIGAATAQATDSELDAWHDAGIRGLRFNEVRAPDGGRYPGSVAAGELAALGPRLAARGWHAEVWGGIDRHAALLPLYRASGVPVVLDHMAGLSVERGLDDPDFQAILAALAEGWLWVKLVLCRASRAFPDYADLRPFHDALIAANPRRLVWGSDWPYLRLGDKAPDVGHVLDLFHAWVRDESVRHRILVENPAELYGF